MEALNILIFLLIISVFGVLPSIWYLKRKKKEVTTHSENPSIWFMILTFLLFCLNIYLSSLVTEGSISYSLGQVLLFPLFMVGIFSFFKESRNWRSRVKIFFYTSLVVLFSLFGNLINYTKEHPMPQNMKKMK